MLRSLVGSEMCIRDRYVGLYISPTNGEYKGSSFNLLPKDPDAPEKWKPTLESYNGANWFDDDAQLLYVVIKGEEPIELLVQPVLQVCFDNTLQILSQASENFL